MKNEVTIRHAQPSDIKKMIEVEISAADVFSSLPLEFLQRMPEEFPPQADSFYESIICLNMAWVICVNTEVVGFICTEKVCGENTLHIHEFDVAQAFQGKGLGTQLLKHVIDYGCKQSISRFTLSTFKEVPWNAPFYSKFGFVMMDKKDVDDRLRALLEKEVAIGLPEDTRCAMQLCVMDNSPEHGR